MRLLAYLSFAFFGLRLHFFALWRWYCGIAAVLVFVGTVLVVFVLAPLNFPTNTFIMVSADESVAQIAQQLQDEHVITSAFLFKVFVRLTGHDGDIHADTYLFAHPYGMLVIANRLTHDISGITSVRVTFPEGMTVRQMSERLKASLPEFDVAAFSATATPYEGYLFPDTYFFTPGISSDEVVTRLHGTFVQRSATIQKQLVAFGKPIKDEVTMASLLEREAKTMEDKRIVAGILWKRLSRGMPLQVDATIAYEHHDQNYVPTASDLKLDSPYNTYLHKGLPPSPICNPGLDSLLAAVTPTATDYTYYLSGSDGTMHYARTFAEHQQNLKRYLK